MKCFFCKRQIEGYGHNPQPAGVGRCCDSCNANIVLPVRVGRTVKAKTGNNEVTEWRNGQMRVFLHQTCIVIVDRNLVVLGHGGHVTQTTAKHMNRVLEDFALPFRVHRKTGKLFAQSVQPNSKPQEVTEKGLVLPYIDILDISLTAN